MQSGSKLIMIGDSITDCDRSRPVGEGLFEAHGKGYVAQVNALLGACHPGHPVRVVNMGCSGNTVLDLESRWQTDVIDLKPDWVSIMIGINDVWRQFDLPNQPDIHVSLKDYTAVLGKLVAKTIPLVKGLVLMTPFYIEPNREDVMRKRMDQYGAAVKAIAEEHGTLFVDTQAVFDELLEHVYPASLAWDRVHVSQTGHGNRSGFPAGRRDAELAIM